MEKNNASVASTQYDNTSNTDNIYLANVNKRAADVQTLIDEKMALSKTSILRYPLDVPKYYLSMGISAYRNRTSPLNIQRGMTESTIIFPLPIEIASSQVVDYDVKALGSVAGLAMGAGYAFKNGEMPQAKLSGTPEEMNKKIGERLKNTATDVTSSLPLVGGTAAALTGVAPNQFQVVLLKGPTYKRLSYQWSFSPKSGKESEEVRKILVLLKNSQAPGMRTGGLVYSFPRVFQLSFVPNPKYLYKHKPAVLERLTVDYTDSGAPSFFKADPDTDNLSAPTSIKVTATFLELEFWLAGDFTDSNNVSGSITRSYSGNT